MINEIMIRYTLVPNCDENIQSEVASHNELSSTNDNELFVVCHYHDDDCDNDDTHKIH